MAIDFDNFVPRKRATENLLSLFGSINESEQPVVVEWNRLVPSHSTNVRKPAKVSLPRVRFLERND